MIDSDVVRLIKPLPEERLRRLHGGREHTWEEQRERSDVKTISNRDQCLRTIRAVEISSCTSMQYVRSYYFCLNLAIIVQHANGDNNIIVEHEIRHNSNSTYGSIRQQQTIRNDDVHRNKEGETKGKRYFLASVWVNECAVNCSICTGINDKVEKKRAKERN